MTRPRTILALDLGTSKVSALAVRISEGAAHILGAARLASAGVRKGIVADLRSAAASLSAAAAHACRAAHLRCERAWLSVSGEHLDAVLARAQVQLDGSAVAQRHLDACLRCVVENARIAPGREVLHVLPNEFTLDGQPGIASPLGMAAARLAAEALVVTASSPALDNLERSAEAAGLTMEQEVLSPLAAAWAVTDEIERAAGALVIDVGAGTTDFIAFRGPGPALVGCLAVAGSHVTRDVAVGLRVGLGEAERVKREYGAALARLAPASEIVLTSGKRADRWFLAEVIEARMREVLELVRERVSAAGLRPVMVVLTGGEARLIGADALAEEVFECPARVGPAAATEPAALARDPAWATALGMARYAAQQRCSGAPIVKAGPLGRAWRWVRESFR